MATHDIARSGRPQATDKDLGPYLRMHALLQSQLPDHSDLPNPDSSTMRPDLSSFIADVLNEGHAFATSTIVNKFKVKSDKESPPSTARVQQLSHEIETKLAGRSNTETWFARISKHENAAKKGTATWEEMDNYLRNNHSEYEDKYTPDIKDAHVVLHWQSQLASLQDNLGGWQNVQMEIREMLHQLPTPLEKRCFSVLVVSGKKSEEFVVVQLPADLTGVPKAKYFGASGITEGIYVSIEYGKLIDNGATSEWRMATASDAKGNLPMWAQKMGVPGAIVKDVGLFMQWRDEERNKS